MRKFGLVFGWFALVASPVSACDFCSPVVFLDAARASCFLDIFDDRLQKLEKGGRGFVEVNLESCQGPGLERDKSVVQSPRTADFEGGSKVYLDKASMICVKDFILEDPQSFDPMRKLAILENCRPESAEQG